MARNGLHCLPANRIGMGNLQLRRLFNNNEALMVGDMIEQRLHQSGLPRTGSAADDAVLFRVDKLDNRIPDMRR